MTYDKNNIFAKILRGEISLKPEEKIFENKFVLSFYDINPNYKPPFITVPRVGTIGQAFVQQSNCCVDNNCMVLLPKKTIDIEELYQIAYQIRLNKWKYK